jgi:hypothetical protein
MGLDICDLGTPGLTYRRLQVILSNAPEDSAYACSARGDSWTKSDHLLAIVADRLAVSNWQRGGGKGTKPDPIPRPGVGPKVTRHKGEVMTLDQARKRFKRS